VTTTERDSPPARALGEASDRERGEKGGGGERKSGLVAVRVLIGRPRRADVDFPLFNRPSPSATMDLSRVVRPQLGPHAANALSPANRVGVSANGREMRLCGVCGDITERKHLNYGGEACFSCR